MVSFFGHQVKGLTNLLKTNPEKGIHGDEADLSCRANAFGANRYPRKKGKSFWVSFFTIFEGIAVSVINPSYCVLCCDNRFFSGRPARI